MIATFMFKFQENSLPQIFRNMFTMNRGLHSYPTRQADNYHVSTWHLETKKRAVSVQGALIWNGLPSDIKNACSLNVFKCVLKKNLLNNM